MNALPHVFSRAVANRFMPAVEARVSRVVVRVDQRVLADDPQKLILQGAGIGIGNDLRRDLVRFPVLGAYDD